MQQKFDTLIRAGILIQISNSSEPRKPGTPLVCQNDWGLGISNGLIQKIGPWTDFSKDLESNKIVVREFIDASHHIVLPGLVNAHSHLPMSLFRGLADDLPFEDWLFKNILPLEARLVSPEFVRLGTELACLESMLSGITTTHDMYYFEEDIADTVVAAGMRGVLGEHIFDLPPPDDKEKKGNDFTIAQRVVEKFKDHRHLHPIISPHAPYTCGDETIKKVIKFSERFNVPIGIHLSETTGEVESSIKQYGATPLMRLYKLGFFERPVIAAHCVHLSDEEIAIAAKFKMGISYNPDSNMKLGVGSARVPKFLEAGIDVGIGTDSAASNNNLNILQEMDTGAKLQKLVHQNNTAITAADMLWMATQGGANALKIGHLVGSLQVGKRADVICVNTQYPHMQPMHDPVAQLVYSAQGFEVDHVIIEGRKTVQEKKCLTIDAQSLNSRIKNYRLKNKF